MNPMRIWQKYNTVIQHATIYKHWHGWSVIYLILVICSSYNEFDCAVANLRNFIKQHNLCAGSHNSPPFPDRIGQRILTGRYAVTRWPTRICLWVSAIVCESSSEWFFQCGCDKLPKLYVESCTNCFDPADPDNFINTIFASKTNYQCSDATLDIFVRWDVSKECLRSQAHAVLDCGYCVHKTGCECSQSSRSMPVVLRSEMAFLSLECRI